MLALKAAYPGLSKTEAKAKAVEALRKAQIIAIFALTKIVSDALAAPELRPTNDRALPPDADSSIRLIDVSLRIDRSRTFPDMLIDRLARRFKKKGLQMAVLRYLALERFAQVDVTASKRQHVFAFGDRVSNANY